MNDQSHLLMSLSYTSNDPRVPEEMRKAADTITHLTAEVERLRSVTVVQEMLIRKAEAENEKLRAAIEAAIVDLTNNQRLQAHRKLARALSGDKHE